MTTVTEEQTIPAPPETVSRGTATEVGLLADARSWSPNTRRAGVAGWKDFTSWCFEHRCAGLPAVPADVGTWSTWWRRKAGRWPPRACAWRRSPRPTVWANMLDLALLQVMYDGGAPVGATSTSMRTAQSGCTSCGPRPIRRPRGAVLYLVPAAVEALLAIRPQEAVINPGTSVFGLSAGQISREDQGGDEDGRAGRRLQHQLAQGRDGPGPERRGAVAQYYRETLRQ